MARFGLSAAAALAAAAPVWASYPPPGYADGPPAPLAIPVAAFDGPAAMPPGPGLGAAVAPQWYGPPGAPPAAVGAPAVDACGYPFDPCLPCQRRPNRAKVAGESWVRGDWLYWDLRDAPVPVLVATGNPGLPDPAVPGRGNITPLGAGPRDQGRFNGVRLSVGRWFDEDGELGLEFSGFVFGREGSAARFSDATGTPIVSVPTLGVNGEQVAFDFAFPGRFSGALTVLTATQLYSGEANFLHRQFGNGCWSVDTLFGYRYLQLNERLDLLGRTTPLGAGVGTFGGATLPAGVTVFTRDSFRARTEFHGAQLGGRVEYRRDMFTVTAFGKGGAGATVQTLRVDGATTATGLGVTRTLAGGVRALPSNIGRDTNTDFSLLGETGIELGFQMTKHLSLRVGYNFLFWSDVLRPGSVVDSTANFAQVPLDPTFVAGRAVPARPATVFRSSDFSAHGLTLGVLVDY